MKTGRKYGEKEKIQILIKSLIFRTLQIYIFSFYAFLFFVSLADAEVLEDVCKYFGGSDFSAGDFGKGVEALAEVFGDEVTWEVVGEGLVDALKGFLCFHEGFVVAEVGDDGGVGRIE